MESFIITIDREIIWEYFQFYKKTNPKIRSFEFATKITERLYLPNGESQLTSGGKQKTKRRKRKLHEITKDDMLYGVMSLNELLVIGNRMTMNGIKKKYGKLGLWLADKYGLTNKQYSNSVMEYRVFKHTKAKADLDNISAGIKILNDGLCVESKAFIDDNYNHINPLLIGIEIDKEHPRTEIRVSIIDDKIKDIYEKMEIHKNNFK